MSISQDAETISITIPALSPITTQQTQISIPVATLKTSVRLVVIISTYLLFRPHLEKLFRTMTGRQNEEELTVKERVDMLKREGAPMGQTGAGTGGKRAYAVATPGGAAASTKASKATPDSSRSTRRKA